MREPRLSVVTAVYNGERYLDETVASVLAQDFRELEYVIVDDASSDGTPEILARWAAADPRVTVLRNEANLGPSASRNRGIRAARGPWIACQDADDVSEAGRFSAQMDWIERNPETVLVATEYVVIDERGMLLRFDRRADVPEVIEFFLRFGNVIGGHSQVLFRREDVLAIGGYNESYRSAEDYDLWTRLAARGDVVILPVRGMRYRLHGMSASRTFTHEQRMTAVRVIQRELQAWLGRSIGEEEAAAVRAISTGELTLFRGPFRGLVPLADRLFAEGELRLQALGAPSDVRRRVRIRTSKCFGAAAVLAVLNLRDPGGALRSLFCAVRRNPWHGLAGAVGTALGEMLVRWRVLAARRAR